MAVGSRAKKEARNSEWGVKKRSISDDLLPNEINLEAPQISLSDPEFGLSSVPIIDADDFGDNDVSINLEEELLSRLDNESTEEKGSFAEQPFNSDISNSIPEKVLEKIASYLEEVTLEDIKSRQHWLDIINKIKPFLGFGLEEASDKINEKANLRSSDSSSGNNNQIKTFDTTFSTALLRLWALLRSELLPSQGPCGFKTDTDNTEAFELQGEMTKDALNEYLTIEDKGFYPDYDRFLLYLLLYGCVFRKVYYDSITKKPISRFIIPEDFLVDNNCSSILESNRLTHIRYLSKREILLNMQDGTFRSVELDYLKSTNNVVDTEENGIEEDLDVNSGIDISAYSTLSRFKFYETHEYLDLNEFFDSGDTWESGSNFLPSPYVITRCGLTNKIVNIIPNWQEDDPTRTRINCFIHYNLFPGFDIYGLGLAQVLGSNAMSLTCMQRMAIDAAIFQNFPGGVKVPGIKNQNNDITITPGQFITLDTGAAPLSQAIMPLPYNGPSPALLEYLQRVTNQTQQLASTSEVGMPENSANTPVGTTMAMLEVANRMQSAILRTVHASFSDEIQLLFQALNPMGTEDRQNDDLQSTSQAIKIIPVSDPSVESTTQRIMKAESLLKIASTDPQLHNMREIYTRVYQALGISDIEQILLPPQQQTQQEEIPVDPQVQVQMADIEQRRLEVESRERIAHLNIEADGYKTQMNIELDKAKMEQDRYIADLKVNLEEVLNQTKLDIDMLKIEQLAGENNADLLQKQQQTDAKSEIELLKIEARERENELKAEIELLKEEIKQSREQLKEEPIYG